MEVKKKDSLRVRESSLRWSGRALLEGQRELIQRVRESTGVCEGGGGGSKGAARPWWHGGKRRDSVEGRVSSIMS